ncbi:MAG: LacI family DNA-binding transcriptional regulator [Bacteroidota bacterium]
MATIRDVAKKAGVSPKTVSRAINGSPEIAPETREKVRRVMEELRYVPNASARRLATGRADMIGLVVPFSRQYFLSDQFFTELVQGILSVTSNHGIGLQLFILHPGDDGSEEIISAARQHKIDGLIWTAPSAHGDRSHELLATLGKQVVVVGRPAYAHVRSVDNDNVRLAADVVRFLTGLGHERIGFINGPLEFTVSVDRLRGYESAMQEAGCHPMPEWVVISDFSKEGGREAARRLLRLPVRPTALFVANDMMAAGVLAQAREDGIIVPAELSVVACNDTVLTRCTFPPLTTVRIPIQDLGKEAASLLIEALSNGGTARDRVILQHEIIVRESSASVVAAGKQ